MTQNSNNTNEHLNINKENESTQILKSILIGYFERVIKLNEGKKDFDLSLTLRHKLILESDLDFLELNIDYLESLILEHRKNISK